MNHENERERESMQKQIKREETIEKIERINSF